MKACEIAAPTQCIEMPVCENGRFTECLRLPAFLQRELELWPPSERPHVQPMHHRVVDWLFVPRRYLQLPRTTPFGYIRGRESVSDTCRVNTVFTGHLRWHSQWFRHLLVSRRCQTFFQPPKMGYGSRYLDGGERSGTILQEPATPATAVKRVDEAGVWWDQPPQPTPFETIEGGRVYQALQTPRVPWTLCRGKKCLRRSMQSQRVF